MRPVLAVLHPRRIPSVIEALLGVDVPKAWISGYTEYQIQQAAWPDLMRQVQAKGYTHMLVVSDDAIVSQDAVDAVLALLEDGHPVASGYSNLDNERDLVNLTHDRLPEQPAVDAYRMLTAGEVAEGPELIETFFSGMTLTAMSLDMWREYPFRVYGGSPGYCSDHHLCYRLQEAGVPIVASKAAFVHHLKPSWLEVDKVEAHKLLIGEIPARVIVE